MILTGIIILAASAILALVNIGVAMMKEDMGGGVVFFHILCAIAQIVGWGMVGVGLLQHFEVL